MEITLRLSLLLATVPVLLGATWTEDGRVFVEEFYRRINSDRYHQRGAGSDLLFVLDRSGSVTRKLWISVLNFVKVDPSATLHYASSW